MGKAVFSEIFLIFPYQSTPAKKDAGPGICSIFMQKSKSFGLWFRFCHRLFRMQHSLRLKLQVKVHSLFVAIFAANLRGKKLEEVDKGKLWP